MKRLMFTLAVLVLFAGVAKAQSEEIPGWKLQVSGGYTNLQNQETNNGFLTSAEVRIAKYWSARLDYFAIASPKAAVVVAGPQYNFSLARILPSSPSNAFDLSRLEAFANARVGVGRGDAESAPFKFAFAAGGGLNYRVSDDWFVRPLEVNYIRSAASGTQVIGNHLQMAASVGFRF